MKTLAKNIRKYQKNRESLGDFNRVAYIIAYVIFKYYYLAVILR